MKKFHFLNILIKKVGYQKFHDNLLIFNSTTKLKVKPDFKNIIIKMLLNLP